MKIGSAIALLAIALISAPAGAADGMTTAGLRSLCAAQSGTKQRLTCDGYLVGFVDGAAMVAATWGRTPWCAKDADIETTFLRYSRAHPEEDTNRAAVTIYLAMTEAYPCK
jgi:hypothetical protein